MSDLVFILTSYGLKHNAFWIALICIQCKSKKNKTKQNSTNKERNTNAYSENSVFMFWGLLGAACVFPAPIGGLLFSIIQRRKKKAQTFQLWSIIISSTPVLPSLVLQNKCLNSCFKNSFGSSKNVNDAINWWIATNDEHHRHPNTVYAFLCFCRGRCDSD